MTPIKSPEHLDSLARRGTPKRTINTAAVKRLLDRLAATTLAASGALATQDAVAIQAAMREADTVVAAIRAEVAGLKDTTEWIRW